MLKSPFRYSSILTNILLILSSVNVFGQIDNGRISGTVTDANGAAIAGAAITVTNEKTGEARNVVAAADGTFQVPALKPSRYSLRASSNNFESVSKNGVEVLVGQDLTFTLILQPKGVTAQIDVVVGENSAIAVSSASMSANVTGREVEGLPINGRQLSQLYLQAPGAQNAGSGTFGDIRFSGRANQQNVIRYDGVEGTGIIDSSPGNLNGEVASPFRLQSSLENVQEFRVDSSNFPAEFGTGTGGQISVITKSGGNQFHGSAFEYLRREKFDARNFFDGAEKSPLTLDQFGGSVGGPIIKNKLFFFASYERYRGRFGLNFVEAAPSLSLAAPGALIPGTTTPVNPLIQPFIAAFLAPGAVVVPGASAASGFDIVQLQDTEKTDEKSFAARFDYKLNDFNSLYFRFFRDEGNRRCAGRRLRARRSHRGRTAEWRIRLSIDTEQTGLAHQRFQDRIQRRANAHQRRGALCRRPGFLRCYAKYFRQRREHGNSGTGNVVGHFDTRRPGQGEQRDKRPRPAVYAVLGRLYRRP
jgi:Carboxypeptidase regulatory-like domain